MFSQRGYEFVGNNGSEFANGRGAGVVFRQQWAAMFSNIVTRSTAVLAVLAVINVAAFFGMLQMGFVPAQTGEAGELQEQNKLLRRCSLPAQEMANVSSQLQGAYYPVCLLLSIGDDTNLPNDKALPFPLLSRLFSGMKAEISTVVKAEEGTNSKRQKTSMNVLVGVDFTSVACKMARDSIEEAGMEFEGVALTCYTSNDERSAQSQNFMKKASCGTVIVGGSAQFVTQLTLEWAQLLRWENLRVIDLDAPNSSHDPPPPALPRELWRPTIATGFSSNHFAVGLLLLRSVGKAGREAALAGQYNISIVVFALEDFNSTLQGILDCVIRELNEDYRIPTELRRFDFLAYPSWMRINQSRGYAGTGEYAWKVVLIRSILAERGFILWADAGCRYNFKGLMESMNYTRDLGFASRGTSGFIPTYVHPGQLKYLGYQVHYDRPRVKNCDGSVVGLTLDKYAELVKPWYDCSITRQCIAPDGSHHGNHRQDQAVRRHDWESLPRDQSGCEEAHGRSSARLLWDLPLQMLCRSLASGPKFLLTVY